MSAYSVIVNDLKSTMGSLGFAIQSSNDFMNNVLIKVIEMESNVSMIGNNSDRIIELHSELESVTSSIKDHNATLQDVISMIGNNSDIIIELYSELESVTSTIQDLNSTLRDVETGLNLTSVGGKLEADAIRISSF